MTKKKIIALFPGRFQLPHKGHKFVFDKIDDLGLKFDQKYIVITRLFKAGSEKYPFTVKDKIKLLQHSGIPTNNILTMSNPYKQDELQDTAYSPKNTSLVYFIGGKDSGRLSSGTYFENIHSLADPKTLKTYNEKAYYYEIPSYVSYVSGHKGKPESATELRNLYKTTKNKKEEELFIKGLYYVDDDQVESIRTILNKRLKGIHKTDNGEEYYYKGLKLSTTKKIVDKINLWAHDDMLKHWSNAPETSFIPCASTRGDEK